MDCWQDIEYFCVNISLLALTDCFFPDDKAGNGMDHDCMTDAGDRIGGEDGNLGDWTVGERLTICVLVSHFGSYRWPFP